MAESTIDANVAALKKENAMLKQKLAILGARQGPKPASTTVQKVESIQDVHNSELTIIVMGASGDLSKKKTYPALFALFKLGLLPAHSVIIGYARSQLDPKEFHKRISGAFIKDPKAEEFLKLCTYMSGNYDDAAAYDLVAKRASELEASGGRATANRLFYLAIPPSLFSMVSASIRTHLFTNNGWNRLVVEKPFGRDLESFLELSRDLAMFTEDELFRIDHYLGKEMVQNLMILRFANSFLSPIWNRQHIAAIVITFKEPIDVEGRGGYFDEFGIVRDVMQNHLLQMMSLVAMEPPLSLAAEDVRDEKTKVLRAVRPVKVDDVVLGQYAGDDKHEGYRQHNDVPKDSRTPTFAAAVLRVDNERWRDVPFFLKCGKALNERKAEIRVQFRESTTPLFGTLARNELVLRVQPDAAVYMKMHTKAPGLDTQVVMRELDLTYSSSFDNASGPDAYERLIYDVLRGDHNLFVRDDELLAAWKIFSPLLHELEAKKVEPVSYPFGSRGPAEADTLLIRNGYVYSDSYQWVQKKDKPQSKL